jgi:hypothetical protein
MARTEIAALSDAHLRGARFVYIAALFAALGGLLFGYDTGVISGALIFIKREFGLTIYPRKLLLVAFCWAQPLARSLVEKPQIFSGDEGSCS